MNEEQEAAIKYLDDTLLIAGAGTGKTTTIINKIDYLINKRIFNEKEILVISFTNESVNDLKKKCLHNLDVLTFHKLAINIINDHNLKLCNPYLLDYIIDEYFNSYAKYNVKTKLIIRRLLLETTYYNLKEFIKCFINLYKSNFAEIKNLGNLYFKEHFINKDYLKIILDIYVIYLRELESSGKLDFNDLITYATKLINNKKRKVIYKYIIIDEFQDTSLIRLNLILAIKNKNNAKTFFVGDDYQSIYRFSGCNLNIFLQIDKYISNIKIMKLKHNYRNNTETINVANDFIMKNKLQLQKETICHKNIDKPIKIIYYVDKTKVINKLLNLVTGNILIMGRNNKDKDDFNVKESDDVKFLTIHRAKGLEFDNVILINLENKTMGFPSKILNHDLINRLFASDFFPYEEERRLMYVALTRSKNNTYLLVPKYNSSVFIKELKKNYANYVEIIKI